MKAICCTSLKAIARKTLTDANKPAGHYRKVKYAVTFLCPYQPLIQAVN